jgi:Autoinducer binding domain/Bacterial regulatory proteins, luxR family
MTSLPPTRESFPSIAPAAGEVDANEVRASIVAIDGAEDDAEVIGLMQRAAWAMGADAAVFTAFTHDDAIFTSYRSLHACDPAWPSLYASQRWAGEDPWLDYARRHSAPTLATQVAVHEERQRTIVEAAAVHGFASAVIVPAPSPHGPSQVGVLCVGSNTAGHFEARGFASIRPLLRGLAMELHDWCHRRMRSELSARAHLTDDDLHLLRQEAAGHGSKEIAQALHTRPITIDCRFQRLNNRLGVATRRDAVRLARLYELI